MSYPSSPHWKPGDQGDEGGNLSLQGWFNAPGNAGQPSPIAPNQDSVNMYRAVDVDGMFGPGAFEPPMNLPPNRNLLGGLGGLSLRTDERETSSLLHILGSDLFHGALDVEGADDDGTGRSGLARGVRPVGRLDELNGSEYVAPDAPNPGSLERKPVLDRAPLNRSSYVPEEFSGRTENGGRGVDSEGVPFSPSTDGYQAQRRDFQGYDFQGASRDAHGGPTQAGRAGVAQYGRSPHALPNGAHQHWMPEAGAPGNHRGGWRGQGQHGYYGGGGVKRGGLAHYNGPIPYGGAGGRGGSFIVNHMRGGGPDGQGGAGLGPASMGLGAVGGGRGMEYRNQNQFPKGGRAHLQQQYQKHPYMNGRPDIRHTDGSSVAHVSSSAMSARSEVRGVDASKAPDAGAGEKMPGHDPGSAGVNDSVQSEEVHMGSMGGDVGMSAAEKELAEKAKREAKKKSKKEKMRKGKEESASSTASTTPVQGTPIIGAKQPQEAVPSLEGLLVPQKSSPEVVAEPESPQAAQMSEQSRQESPVPDSMPATAGKDKGKWPAAKQSNASQTYGGLTGAGGNKASDTAGKVEKSSKGAQSVAKKQKETSGKKNQQQQKQQQGQRKGRAVVYEETDDEEEAPTMSMLQTSVQAVKEWMLAFGKPHPRRRGRSKAYKMWMNMGLRAGMLLVIIWAVTMVMTPGGRHDSSCRLMNDAVRQLCKDMFGFECRSLASKSQSVCYFAETIPGMRLLEILVLWILRLGRLSSFFTRHANTVNRGLIARCRLLPLQHHCSLGGPGHHDRLRWHLDTVLKLQQLEREGSFSNGLCVGDKCGALSMSRWNSGIRRHTGAYSLLCEQQFGEGAEFDGEMCACRKGYIVRGGMCRKVARGGKGGSDDAGLAQLEGSGKSKRLGAAGSGSAAKCASRTKSKKGKSRKFKNERGGAGSSRRGGTRHIDAGDP